MNTKFGDNYKKGWFIDDLLMIHLGYDTRGTGTGTHRSDKISHIPSGDRCRLVLVLVVLVHL